MSWLLLIDGYNIVSPVAPPRTAPGQSPDPNWLHRERMLLVRRLVDALPAEIRQKTCVVFDAANPPRDRPSEFTLQDLSVRFAVDHPQADDLLEEMIRAHHTPKRLMVVSSDHRVQAAARRRGAKASDSEPWFDSLLDGEIILAIPTLSTDVGGDAATNGGEFSNGASGGAGQGSQKVSGDLPADEVAEWMDEFGFSDE